MSKPRANICLCDPKRSRHQKGLTDWLTDWLTGWLAVSRNVTLSVIPCLENSYTEEYFFALSIIFLLYITLCFLRCAYLNPAHEMDVCMRLTITASNPIFCRSPRHSFSSVLADLQSCLPQLMNSETEVTRKARRRTFYENGFMKADT
jgi:hypothetical protein